MRFRDIALTFSLVLMGPGLTYVQCRLETPRSGDTEIRGALPAGLSAGTLTVMDRLGVSSLPVAGVDALPLTPDRSSAVKWLP